jgi:hypothetical protein
MRDDFDARALPYEHVSVLSRLVSWLNRRMG